MSLLSLNRTIKSVRRLREIIKVFAKHGFGHIIARMDFGRYAPTRWRFGSLRRLDDGERTAPLSVPERLRLAFEELGPTFIKLGQILSTRADLISAIIGQEEALQWVEEFEKLRSQAAPFPFFGCPDDHRIGARPAARRDFCEL